MNPLFPAFSQNAFYWAFLPLILWDLIWRGIALWKSSRNNQPYWFVALLVLNTVGILPIIYLAIRKFSAPNKNKAL